MIHLTCHSDILIATQPADFRQGIDGLAALCQQRLHCEPRSGTLFVFINRSKTMVRALAYENNGFWLMTKRLSKGKFSGWPTVNSVMTPMDAKHLRQLLSGHYTPL
ncbi:MAG: IS66 family insertion sequence element accessory protein TnpB [Psychromonas sp.]